MNTYRVILGCLVILCYLRQQAWGVPSQMENAKPFHWEAEDVSNEVNLKDHAHIQKRLSIAEAIQNVRNVMFRQYKCNYIYLKSVLEPVLNVSNAMYAYASSYLVYFSQRLSTTEYATTKCCHVQTFLAVLFEVLVTWTNQCVMT